MIIPVELNITEQDLGKLKKKILYDNKFGDIKFVLDGAVICESPVVLEKLLVHLEEIK